MRNFATQRLIVSSVILAAGMIVGGFALGDGLKRAQRAERAVTVRGLAERDVTADLATWTISYSSTATALSAAQANVDHDTAQIRAFFRDLGFPADALQPTGVNVSQFKDNGVPNFTVRQRMTLRTHDIKRAQDAVRRQFDLVRGGVILEEGSGMSYTFTKLNDIKPAMVAEATKDARAAAEQFAKDSGAEVGSIKNATQGYFSINARDGDSGGGWGVSDTPYKQVRVVTTVNFYLK
ncbi:SIMPL domain-containing protein [Novosphingobium mangrovi (ex Huang et al. 2023)]|uniref:SIMPL domain-containing protein n=1 Tax=Novosphingobium mangrovi (ex Huang et al. 2023) TaxID=2976432 RepID=A0ABT2I4K3_9SPHN|nr:SIMPL domain-containing protein [Novosphingobium mangrovi (ex Huang et al. 2023)]MCT2399715.1 SIMPL domain-containing protein [Novosphingobium mangrovi (ex Huang et al. 2023)]